MTFKSYKNWLNEQNTIKIGNYDLPISIIKKEDWPEGKNDPTEFSSDEDIVRVREDYDYKKDPVGWIRHEAMHHKLHHNKGFKDDGKEYPTNNTEEKAYIFQFKYLKNKGYKKSTSLSC